MYQKYRVVTTIALFFALLLVLWVVHGTLAVDASTQSRDGLGLNAFEL